MSCLTQQPLLAAHTNHADWQSAETEPLHQQVQQATEQANAATERANAATAGLVEAN